ncbi:DNA cytosine methyltransferase [Phormidium tenue]|uniref:DNA (cytosine-5-)-methyltransferase n=1 Tax=Phormidium tenue FACHB-1050 TaxID=2692857 RepID=A0ABR8C786_9CYAN|nr:DNA (cytosine-5-)-methyltransferase [Phormidium tenue]MBD2316638.1 DNA (cytosine-5-)-methyltransferase [Phormidium tenue FACHB-1050]
MRQLTEGSLFTGFGGVDLGYKKAGLEHAWGLEYDPKICEVANANFGGSVRCMNILDADPFKFEKVDVLHASPVCKSYSIANPNKRERQLDLDCARKVAEFIQVLQPQYFTLENVEAYRKSKSFNLIIEMLYSQGYWVQWQVLNAADFGVPQSRRRLILIANKNEFIPPLPAKEKHIGWYEAIADLVHDLPNSQLADWQLKALPNEIREHLFYSYGSQNINFGGTIQPKNKPANTLLSDCCSENGIRSYKAILIENTGARSDRELQTREAIEPCWTLRAMGQDGHYHRANALLENTRTVALDIACLARLQSFPDDYQWSGKKSLDGKGIGNSVPPLMMEKIAKSVFY